MLIPALFVAHSVKTMSARSVNRFDVIVFAQASEVTDVHRRWMEEHGIMLCDDFDLSRLHGAANIQERLSVMTLVKLMLAEHLAGRYDKILYLDVDTTIHDDVAAIFSLDTGEFVLGAAGSARILSDQSEANRKTTIEHFQALGMTPPYRFFNSGVLYIDVDKWNRGDISARTLDFIRRHRDLCYLPDEHGLNGVLDGAIAELSPIWNMRPAASRRADKRRFSRPVIVHYIGEDKPWRRFGYRKRLFPDPTAYRLYKSFLKATPWPKWLDEHRTSGDMRLTVVWEIRLITRALRGWREGPSWRRRRAFRADIRQYYAEGKFADVDQGIVRRVGSRLQLIPQQAAAL